jgi:hypothetical protein
MSREKYLCKECGNEEFVTMPNRYDVFVAMDDKLYLQSSECTEEDDLFCRECYETLTIDSDDIVY